MESRRHGEKGRVVPFTLSLLHESRWNHFPQMMGC